MSAPVVVLASYCKCGHSALHHFFMKVCIVGERRFNCCTSTGCHCDGFVLETEEQRLSREAVSVSSRARMWHEKQKAFMEAAYAFNAVWTCSDLPGEFGSEQYPFAQSFDEVCARIHDWVEHYSRVSEASCGTII